MYSVISLQASKDPYFYHLTVPFIFPINPPQVGKENDLFKKCQLVFFEKAAV